MCKHRFRYESLASVPNIDYLERECLKCGLRQTGYFKPPADPFAPEDVFIVLEELGLPKKIDYTVYDSSNFY